VTRPRFRFLFEIIETLALTLVIFLVIQNFVAQPYQVQQRSMEHTLEPTQYVLVDKLTARFDDYKRGDIVVFNPPSSWAQRNGTPFIKRVIGVGGDTIEIRDERVYVDGVALDEPYVFDLQPTTATGDRSTWVVPMGDLFLMGDHRADSSDSRVFGPVERDQVIGRAWLRYWPFDVFGVLPTATHPELVSLAP
jgi:signal peptidase I